MMLFKFVLLCFFWFIFGVITGFKIASFVRKIHIDFPEEMTEEEMDKIFDEIMEKLNNEQKRND